MIITKICHGTAKFVCGKEKPLSEFGNHVNGIDGHKNQCKECAKKQVAQPKEPKEELEYGYKRCTGKCKEVKYFTEFHKTSTGIYGVTSRCKVCRSKPKAPQEVFPEGHKRCIGGQINCNEVKPLSEFGQRGLQCKKCRYKQYKKNNPDCGKKYYEDNKDLVKKRSKQRRIDKRELINKQQVDRRKNDLGYKILCNMRGRLNKVMNGQQKSDTTKNLIGCEFDFLKQHFRDYYYSEMEDNNYGSYWVIDHIIPCALFDLTNPEHQKICFHWTNLQPLTVADNLEKGERLDWVRK